mgnify:CR=1 FL=1
MIERWPLLDSQALLIDQVAQAVERARSEMQARVQLAFNELSKIRATPADGKSAKLVMDGGKLFLEVSDAENRDSHAGPERSGSLPAASAGERPKPD